MADDSIPHGADNGDGRPAGLFASLRGVFDTVLGIARTRLDLVGIELAEEKERLVGLLVTVAAIVFALAFAVLFLTLAVVALFWENRVIALGACTLVYAGVGAWLVAHLRAQLAAHPPLFAATIAELAKDRDALRETMSRPSGVPPLP